MFPFDRRIKWKIIRKTFFMMGEESKAKNFQSISKKPNFPFILNQQEHITLYSFLSFLSKNIPIIKSKVSVIKRNTQQQHLKFMCYQLMLSNWADYEMKIAVSKQLISKQRKMHSILENFFLVKQDSFKLVSAIKWVGMDLWNIQRGINLMQEDTAV